VPTPSDRSSTPAKRGDATSSKIEHEALGLFERQGFRTTTMREITAPGVVAPSVIADEIAAGDLSLPDHGFVGPAVAVALILGIVHSLPTRYAETGESTPTYRGFRQRARDADARRAVTEI
jgi:hypothetical protein